MESQGAECHASDGAIVRRVVAGDVDAFEGLVDRHGPRVRRLVARNVPRSAVDEVAHDAFVAAYLALGSYVESHPFGHWLARIALRSCADHWRAHGRNARLAGTGELDGASIAAAPDLDGDDRELCEWALGQLGREDREVLTLVYFEGFSMKECAQVLSWSESNVKVRAHRARANLRRILGRLRIDGDGRP